MDDNAKGLLQAAPSTEAALGSGIGPQVCRAIYWHEMGAEEKLETLGHTVEAQARHIRELEAVTARLSVHTHGDGGPLIPLDFPKCEVPYYLRNPLSREHPSILGQY